MSEQIKHDGQTAMPPVALQFFAYDADTGFEVFSSETDAKEYARAGIESCREDASEGWPEAVENICWGVVLGTTKQVELTDDYDGEHGVADSPPPVDYVLTDCQQPASAQPATVPDGWPNELLGWVSACQSAYHIDSTPGHRFGGLGSNLEENRAAVVEHVASLLAAATDKQRQAHLAERHAYLQERAKCEQLEARIADLELALFAENQKRQEVEQQLGQLLVAQKP